MRKRLIIFIVKKIVLPAIYKAGYLRGKYGK